MNSESIALFKKILDAPSLSDEAKRIVCNILKSKTIDDFIRMELDEDIVGEIMVSTSFSEVKDCRVRKIVFADFRSFPQMDDVNYGVDFVGHENVPCNLFLLGSNGTGKSSIFTALEMFFTGHSSLAEERKVKENKYLIYGFKEDNSFELKNYLSVELASDNNLIVGDIATPSSFCSSYDIQLLEKSENLTDYIFKQLGYGEVIKLNEFLEVQQTDLSKKAQGLDNVEQLENSSRDLQIIIQEFCLSISLSHYPKHISSHP